MSNNYTVPTKQAIAGLLAMIFGDELGADAVELADLADLHVATFIDDDDNLVALCASDKEFVAYSGAALSMIPADVADEMISGNAVTDAMVSNFHEVMNICSKLLMTESGSHLRLDKVLKPEEASSAIGALQDAPQSAGFAVAIPKYGTGRLSFIVS